ncbi:MAG: Glu/Leu/Phe/Val dehydrogenase [Chitinophagales bacterium]|nr:Glu/Leu/Phe/Val dehydrogenase [Chitinophagales bacterium]
MSVLTPAPADINNASVFEQLAPMEHEQVVFCYDKATGLKSIIAIHNTILGPSLGGTRFWNYSNDHAALKDALRLSRGMTYKAAITGLHLGGGKAVIIGDPRKDKTETLLRRYGKFVESLNGKYITAEDVGTSSSDMEYIARETSFVTGLPEYMGGGGDPSPFTAYGVYLGMKASAKEVYGNDSLQGKKVVVQGVGHVGEHLVALLEKEGSIIYITDIFEDRLAAISNAHRVTVVPPEEVYNVDADIYAPCALGATINDDTIGRLKCSIIAGAANNQLASEEVHGQMLLDKGILFAPDFLINAGGLVNVGMELETYNENRVKAECERIYNRTLTVFKIAKEKNLPTYKAANEMAEERLRNIAVLNSRK